MLRLQSGELRPDDGQRLAGLERIDRRAPLVIVDQQRDLAECFTPADDS